MHWSRKKALLRRQARIERIEDAVSMRRPSIRRNRDLLRCEALLVVVAAELAGTIKPKGEAFLETVGVKAPSSWWSAKPTGDTAILFPEGW